MKAKVFSLIAAYIYSLCRCELTPLHKYIFRIHRMSLRFAGHGYVLEGRRVFLRCYGDLMRPTALTYPVGVCLLSTMLSMHLEDSTMCGIVNTCYIANCMLHG